MLELKSLDKAFAAAGGARRVIAQGLDLTVAPGETVALLGASGSGKSTLLKMIAGLDVPDAGRVFFDAADITALAPERRRFALMFQDYALFPHLDVRDNVAFGLIEQRLPRRDARNAAQALLATFGLAGQTRSRVWTLSGGEQQRVALARALITQPRLLLLDEPFAALDAGLRTSLRDEFRAHITQAGIGCLLVTHDEAEARALAGRALRLADGRLHPLW